MHIERYGRRGGLIRVAARQDVKIGFRVRGEVFPGERGPLIARVKQDTRFELAAVG